MNKASNLFDSIGNVQLECDNIREELRKKYAQYEDTLTLLDPESEDGQALIKDMNQIRTTIDKLDLVMRSLNKACDYADDARWSIKNLERYWEA